MKLKKYCNFYNNIIIIIKKRFRNKILRKYIKNVKQIDGVFEGT
jgi:hypothetical protein